MPKCLDVGSWRPATREELGAYYDMDKKQKGGSHLVIRTHLRPSDVYAYLRARFGKPNGIQNYFRSDDSDNLIHWDFNLKAGDADVYLSGTSRDIHVHLSESLTDAQWKSLILALKVDFRRIGHDKSAMLRSFEKYVVFQNKFKTLAMICSEIHESIVDTPPRNTAMPTLDSEGSMDEIKKLLDTSGKRATDLFGNCLKLRLLTPIMAEAFINMTILTFCKDEIRDDPRQYDAFIRAKIPERLELLPRHCDGFDRSVDPTSEAYRGFMRVINTRNFALHGNVDPIREQIETVYFEGKRPLFAQSGNHHLRFFEHLELINKPDEVVRDYEAVHLFLHEITSLLSPRYRAFFDQVIDDPYPGFEVRIKRVNKILPHRLIAAFSPGQRFDDELNVDW